MWPRDLFIIFLGGRGGHVKVSGLQAEVKSVVQIENHRVMVPVVDVK